MKDKIKSETKNVEEILDNWFLKLVHGTIFQRDTILFNKLHDLKVELKKDLGLIKETSVASTAEQKIEEIK